MRSPQRALLLLLSLGLVVRLGLVWGTRGVDTQIVDEQHYATLARNVVAGNGFAWGPGQPTSIRPPLYPAFVAGVFRVAGPENLTAVRLAQIPLSLATVWVVYLIGARLYGPRTGLWAAAGMAFYPSLLFSGVLILSETLFTFLLAVVLLGTLRLLEKPAWALALAVGAGVGASALTRSVMYPFIVILAAGALVALSVPWRRRLAVAVALVAGYFVVMAPWAYRNTKLQHSVVLVDTMGGLNLMMGNYAYTPEDRMWDGVAITGDRAWYATLPPLAPDGQRWTEGTKDKWAQRQGVAFIKAYPGTFIRRAVLKMADFWGIERDYLAGVQHQLYQPPTWFFVPSAAAMLLAYAAVLLLGVIGICLVRPADWRAHVLLVGLMLFVSGLHSVVFGHPRYHLPLVPILLVYGAAAIDLMGRGGWRHRWRSGAGLAAAGLLLGVGAVWAREVFVRDADKVAALVRMVGL